MNVFAWIILQTVLGMYCTSVIMTTSRHGWIIVRVGTMIFCCSYCCFQYQLVLYCTEQIYVAFKTNLPSEIICPSIFILFCSVYASDMNRITQNPSVVVSAVLTKPYLFDWTNDAILSIIPSRKTWCILSNASKGVGFGVRWMILQLLYDTRTGH